MRSRGSMTEKWIHENYPDDPLLSLEPNPPKLGSPTVIGIRKDLVFTHTAFIGTLNPLHNPILFLESAMRLSQQMRDDYVIQFPFWQNQYLYHQLLKTICEIIHPTEIYLDDKIVLPSNLAYLNAQKVCLDESPTEIFLKAKRRSFWSEFLSQSILTMVSLDEVRLEGSRMGCGQVLNTVQFNDSVVYAEILGIKLFVVTSYPLTTYQKKRLLDQTGTLKIIETSWDHYSGLVCNLQEKSVLNVHLSVIQKIDFVSRIIYLFIPEPSPIHLTYLQLGIMRLNGVGKEIEDRNVLFL